jgi:glutamine phosphoribosylpyrophosphate amidotransferase
MCGIYGVLGPGIMLPDLKIFEDLGIVSLVRGTDGAGLFSVPNPYPSNKNNEVKTVKTGQDFLALMYQLEQEDKDSSVKVSLKNQYINVMNHGIIGHNRAATIGSTCGEGAHPFYSKDKSIIGCHNGTITDSTEYGKSVLDRVDGEKFFTDSHVLIDDISKHGPDILSKLDDSKDAYSIVWYNTKTQKTHYVRNNKRSMSFAASKDRRVLYMCSEEGLLSAIMSRHNVSHKIWTPTVRFVFEFSDKNLNTATGTFKWLGKYLPDPDFKTITRAASHSTPGWSGPWFNQPEYDAWTPPGKASSIVDLIH